MTYRLVPRFTVVCIHVRHVVCEIVLRGCQIHPIPTYDNLTALELMIERMEQVGIYLMYDMRWTYMNSTAVTEEVNRVKNSPALLLWYTGDEPDGTSDPLDATSSTYDLIYSLDGYHPVSLVLNCENYFWTDYTAGTDIVMQDTYMVGINATWSTVWVRVLLRLLVFSIHSPAEL